MEKVDLKMRNVIFFDGVCHLCNGFVDEVLRRDKTHQFLFAPLQGETAAQLLPENLRTQLDSVIYFESGQIYQRSTAILRILTKLGGAYRLLTVAGILPRPFCDFIYNIIARNRYSWFGQRDFCRLPTPEERDYLLP